RGNEYRAENERGQQNRAISFGSFRPPNHAPLSLDRGKSLRAEHPPGHRIERECEPEHHDHECEDEWIATDVFETGEDLYRGNSRVVAHERDSELGESADENEDHRSDDARKDDGHGDPQKASHRTRT